MAYVYHLSWTVTGAYQLMTTVSEQIQSADEAICRNIESLADQRALRAQNILSQLRNLVEGVAVRLHAGSPNAEFSYPADVHTELVNA